MYELSQIGQQIDMYLHEKNFESIKVLHHGLMGTPKWNVPAKSTGHHNQPERNTGASFILIFLQN